MIPKLEFTAESWPEEYRAEVVEALDKHFDLNGNEDIRCHPHNANGHIYAFKGYENYRATLLDYGYADTEAAIEKYLQQYIDEPNELYFVEIGLMCMDYDKYYKNGSYINEDGEDTEMDYWDYWDDDSENKPTQEYEGNWVTFTVYILETKI
jgi:hypothetical protein